MPLNKRVFSANRASSLNASGGGAGSGPTVIIAPGSAGSNAHQAQQFSMQQRRRQQNAFSGKVPANNFTGPATGATYGAGTGNRNELSGQVANQVMMHNTAQSASSGNFMQLGGGTQIQSQKSAKLAGIKANMVTS